MKYSSIAVLDSGVGGLSVLKSLVATLPFQRFIYYGDNENAPYGNRSERELLSLTVENVSRLISFGATSIVFGCNTISLTVLQKIKKIFNIPIFGIFPPVETYSMSSGNTLLLSTVRTSEYFRGIKGISVLGLPNLAEDIEKNVFSLKKIDLSCHLKGVNGWYDTVILGCTHYNLIKNQIFNHLKPHFITDGVKYSVDKVVKNIKNAKSSVFNRENKVRFIGKNSDLNQRVWSLVVKNI